ncbi:MAG TPA: hypothetical protein VFG86_23130, partial [Chloroflexota bacterium]|nr:hypothetical protein [Chloroflexota bacterium]
MHSVSAMCKASAAPSAANRNVWVPDRTVRIETSTSGKAGSSRARSPRRSVSIGDASLGDRESLGAAIVEKVGA